MSIKHRIRAIRIQVRRWLRIDDHADVFDRIYRENRWHGGSGPGSSAENTQAYRQFLQEFLRTNRIKSVLDLGCGDWQFSQLIDWGGIRYTGADVSEIALASARKHATANVSFIRLDATRDELPGADLLIAKDVLQHWSNRDILALFPKLSRFRFALITNGVPSSKAINADIVPGRMRPLDLSIAPFNLAGSYVFEFVGDEPKRTFLWRRPGP